jgi:hypothetical protein
VEREHYLTLLGRALGIPVETLRREQAQLRAQASRKKSQPPVARDQKTGRQGTARVPPEPDFGPPDDAGPPPGYGDSGFEPGWETGGFTPLRGGARPGRRVGALEAHFLRQVLEQPGALTRVNAYLRAQKQREVAPHDFARAEDRAIFAAADARTLAGPAVASIEELCDSLGAVLAERVRTLLALPPTPETKLDKLPESLTLSVLDWRLEKLKEDTAQLQGQIQSAAGDLAANERKELDSHLVAMAGEMRRIHQAKNALSALGRRRTEEAARRGR